MAVTVNLKGNPVALAGPEINVGDRAPEAVVVLFLHLTHLFVKQKQKSLMRLLQVLILM